MSATKQPVWKYVGNLGDCNPVDYGGALVLEDTTGVYAPECIDIEPVEGDDGELVKWIVRRWIVKPCTVNDAGLVSDNPFHPDHAAWFDDKLAELAECYGMKREEFVAMLTGSDVMSRARAWADIGDYFGKDNLDGYPLEYTKRGEVEAIVAARKAEGGEV
jgi:hypothetical protein